MKDSDNALIALAAKSIGLSDYWDGGNGEDKGPLWNPLCDDGDALRLAVKLGMLSTRAGGRYAEFETAYLLALEDDMRPTEATRFAIVTVAAGVGNTMP